MNKQDVKITAALSGAEGTRARAEAIAASGGFEAALAEGTLPQLAELSLSEALVLGLLKQGTRKYLAIFGHGSTDLGEVLRIYTEAGVTQTYNFRNEVEMAHAATALSWHYGEVPALVTSIGPGALQAMAGSLAAASNGVGVWHVYGDETTLGEGYNMQQIPKAEQALYPRMTALMGESYMLWRPQALRDALRRGGQKVFAPAKAGPFYLHLPINVQPEVAEFNLASFPARPAFEPAGTGRGGGDHPRRRADRPHRPGGAEGGRRLSRLRRRDPRAGAGGGCLCRAVSGLDRGARRR